METIRKAILDKRSAIVLAVVMIALAPRAVAKKADKPTQSASVLAHVPLPGAAATQMFLQVQDDRRFLYIDQGTNQGYTIVDVSKPSHPSIVKHVDSGKLQLVGSELALAEVPEQSKTVARSHMPTETLSVIDTSDPANPKTIQEFKGVTSVLQDNGRSLIFLTNNEGLWVLKHTAEPLRPARKKPPCGSESAISAMPPDCE